MGEAGSREVVMQRRLLLGGTLMAVALMLSGCASPNPLTGTPGAHGVAGFWAGVWHGVICPISFALSLFDHRYAVYEVHNNGGWYNFGFLLGVGAWAGGGAAGRRR
jgi:hypothetical protein